MGMARLATAVLILVAAPAFADSVVTWTLQVDGDNHADSVKAGTRVAYTEGATSDGTIVTINDDVLNWAAAAQVAGNHNQSGHPAHGLPTQGIANFVVSVELHQDTAGGPLVAADFYSSIHDGTGALPCDACAGGDGVCAGSAFALSYDLVGWGASRVTEAYSYEEYGGPFMEVCMWPTVDSGKILGTGAGYAQWCRGCGLGSITTKGVGQTTAEGGLGIVPLVEGQIDASTLPEGTYVLVLTPGTGTNVLRGDQDLVSAPAAGNPQVAAFAVAANSAVGDTITFELEKGDDPPPCNVPVVTAAESVKTHGAAGDFGIDIYNAGGLECRAGGPTKLVLTFDRDITGAGGSLDASDVEMYDGSYSPAGTISSIVANGSVLTIDVTGIADQNILILGLSGIVATCDPLYACSDILCFEILEADVSGTKPVNIFDLLDVRNGLGQAIDGTNFRRDIDADGDIDIFDLLGVRNKLNNTISVSCP